MIILTWNILHPDSGSEFEAWEQRKPRIVDIIKSYNPDLICLQEVDLSNDEFVNEFQGYHKLLQSNKKKMQKIQQWKEGLLNSKPHSFACVTLIRDTYKIVEVSHRSRTLTTVVEIDGITLKISNIHLEAGDPEVHGDIHRQHLNHVLDSDIICGDFNARIYSPACRFLNGHGFRNAYIKLPDATYIGENPRVIDHIYYKGREVKQIQWGITDRCPSDHIPVVVEL